MKKLIAINPLEVNPELQLGAGSTYDISRGVELAGTVLGSFGLMPKIGKIKANSKISKSLEGFCIAWDDDYQAGDLPITPMVVPVLSDRLPLFGKSGLINRFDRGAKRQHQFDSSISSGVLDHMTAQTINSMALRGENRSVDFELQRGVGYRVVGLLEDHGGVSRGLRSVGSTLDQQRHFLKSVQQEAASARELTTLGALNLPGYIIAQAMARESMSISLDVGDMQTRFAHYPGQIDESGDLAVPSAHFNYGSLLIRSLDESAYPKTGIRTVIVEK